MKREAWRREEDTACSAGGRVEGSRTRDTRKTGGRGQGMADSRIVE